MPLGSRSIKNIVKLPYNWSLGPVWTKFFDFLKKEKIYGTKCKQCNKTLVPARPFCPECYSKMEEWVEIGQEGSLETWAIVRRSFPGQAKNFPYVVASIRLDGADCNFCHFIAGNDFSDENNITKKLIKGMRVKAVWGKEKSGNIYDLSHFEPVTK